uniref:UBC core domain-containing protein n=1 Tax=Panagrolaimus sp. JU765 TaxID=591449 RepID=A0AC34QR81_9BILA
MIAAIDPGLNNPTSSPPSMAVKRLKSDYKSLIEDPLPSITAHPLPENILEWHFLIFGAEDTPYAGGYYHGKLVFPPEFPLMPPSIYMITPSGRFITDRRLCLSISDFHPESWNPAWTVSAILMAIMSFMNEKTMTHGAILSTDDQKIKLAQSSLEFNLNNPLFRRVFPELVEMSQTVESDEESEDDQD